MRLWLEWILNVTIGTVVIVVLFFGAFWVLAITIEGISEHNEARDRCLKRATNGYEIERCR